MCEKMNEIDFIIMGKYGVLVFYLMVVDKMNFDEILSALYPVIAKEIYNIEV